MVTDKTEGEGSLVNVGLRYWVPIDRVLTSGVRCTVRLDQPEGSRHKQRRGLKGSVVSPAAPREETGTYWGYTVRMASSVESIFKDCPYGDEDGYDLKIGTSERGSVTVDDKGFSLPPFRHAVIVFGGVAGIEEAVDADEGCRVGGANASELFDMWVNTCPFQGSRTVRTEEAVLLSLARIRQFVVKNKMPSATATKNKRNTQNVEFSDSSVSEESSGSGNEESSGSSSSEEG